MFIGLWALLLLCLVLFHRKIIELVYNRLRLTWYVMKIPGPFSIPLLGTTWQLKWKIDGLLFWDFRLKIYLIKILLIYSKPPKNFSILALATQLHEWFFYYKAQKIDLMSFWLGPIAIVNLFSAESVKVGLKIFDWIIFSLKMK